MKIKFLCGEIDVPEGYAEYLNLRRHYVDLAADVCRKASKTIGESDFGDAWHLSTDETISDGAWRWGRQFEHKWIDPVVEDALATFRRHKCYEMDFDRFWDYYLDTSPVDDCLYKWTIQGGVLSRIEDAEDCREVLRQERVSHAKRTWSGGALGGGISAALKGAVRAELLNYAGAAVVGIFNKIGRSRSVKESIEQAVQAFSIFQTELLDAIHDTIVGFAGAVAEVYDYLIEDGVGGYETKWDCGDLNRIDALFANLRKGLVPEEDRKMVALEVVKGCPHRGEVYVWMYDNFPDERESVDKLADFFCVTIDKHSSTAKAKECKQAKKECVARKKKLKIDESRRTVFGIVYPSLKDAQEAKKDTGEFLHGIELAFDRAFKDERDCLLRKQLNDGHIERLNNYFGIAKSERVICFFDTTMWSSGKYGLCISSFGLRWRNKDENLSGVTNLSWREFAASEYKIHKDDSDNILLAKSTRWHADYAISRIDKLVAFLRLVRQYYCEGCFS